MNTPRHVVTTEGIVVVINPPRAPKYPPKVIVEPDPPMASDAAPAVARSRRKEAL